MTSLAQGLNVSLLGLVITFLALGVFILIMIVLQKLFPGKAEQQVEQLVEDAPMVLEVKTSDDSLEGEVIAAIGAAVTYVRQSGRGQLGGSLAQPRGEWWAARLVSARGGAVRRR
jgi:Na+-transporting methylmalonyl-CoA/oxaloacetate decarboxylase gamma subunit